MNTLTNKIISATFAVMFLFAAFIGLAAIEQAIAQAKPAFEAVVVLCGMCTVAASVMALHNAVEVFKRAE